MNFLNNNNDNNFSVHNNNIIHIISNVSMERNFLLYLLPNIFIVYENK